jgi:hypothetical protein
VLVLLVAGEYWLVQGSEGMNVDKVVHDGFGQREKWHEEVHDMLGMAQKMMKSCTASVSGGWSGARGTGGYSR